MFKKPLAEVLYGVLFKAQQVRGGTNQTDIHCLLEAA